MRKWDKKDIVELMTVCGETAFKYYGKGPVRYKDDRSLVTQADEEIEAFLAESFDRPAEEVFMIGEESSSRRDDAYSRSALERTAWIVDPIDGTAPYSCGMPVWGTSIALMTDGVIREGAIYLPCSGELFITDGPEVFYCRAESPRALSADKLVPMPFKKRPLDDSGVVCLSQRICKDGKIKITNPVQALCSCVYALSYLALGKYLAYMATIKLWDIAGGMAILERGDFKMITLENGPLPMKITDSHYFLESGPRRWMVKGHVIFAPEDETVEFLQSRLTL
jgi:fructose-1,6-bisphosphatase/inositol monophosphatase family enzyme